MAGVWRWVLVVGLVGLVGMGSVESLRFDIEQKECWVHEVPSDGELVHVSFTVFKINQWAYRHTGADLVIWGPKGEPVHSLRQRMEGKFNFTAPQRGPYKFCFHNRAAELETIDFNVNFGRVICEEEHVKDEHFTPLMAHIQRLEDALGDVDFEQHWLRIQTERQGLIMTDMSKRMIYKAVLESLSLVGCSVLQVILLERLFEQKLGIPVI